MSDISLIEKVLPPEQQKVAQFLKEKIFSKLPENQFFLGGGTAIALRYGHRQSIDFDFFSFPKENNQDPFIGTVDRLFRKAGVYQRKDIVVMYGELHYSIENVGITFIPFQNRQAESDQELYQIPLFPTEKNILGLDTLSIQDLAGMKAFARTQRSKMKDLVDIGEMIAQGLPLQDMIDIAIRQFAYDISAKEIVVSCLDVEDILDNTSDEPIVFLNHQNQAHYIKLLKQQIADYYNERP